MALNYRRAKELTPWQYLRARQKLDREWAPYLTFTEFRVLSWLFAHIVAWHFTEGEYSLDRMLNGIPAENGSWKVVPIGVSSATLRRALAELSRKGFIQMRRAGYAEPTRFKVNLNWTPPRQTGNGDSEESAGPTSEWPNGAEPDENECSNSPIAMLNLSKGSAKVDHPHKIILTRRTSLKDTHRRGQTPKGAGYRSECLKNPEALRVVTDLEKIPLELKKQKEAGQQKETGPSTNADPFDPAVLWKIWSVAWRETWPEAAQKLVRWTGRERAMLKHMVLRWPKDSRDDFLRFFDWSTRNWTYVIATRFQWMSRRPPAELPNVAFLCRFLHEFAASFCERSMQEFLAKQPAERESYWKERRAGKTHEEAVLEVATHLALAADRKQRENDLKEAARLWRQVDLMRKQMAEARFWSKENPHPDSARAALSCGPLENHFDKEYRPFPVAPWDNSE